MKIKVHGGFLKHFAYFYWTPSIYSRQCKGYFALVFLWLNITGEINFFSNKLYKEIYHTEELNNDKTQMDCRTEE